MINETRKMTMARYNEQNKARILHQSAQYRDALRLEMIQAYGGHCQHCQEADPLVLVLDHINDDPELEYELAGTSSRGGYNLYRRLRREGWPKERFQLLCCNCNIKKEHKRRRDKMVEVLGPEPEIGVTISRAEARAKAGPNSNNTSMFKGVVWDKARSKWIGRLLVNGVLKTTSRFENAAEAAKAQRALVLSYYPNANVLTDAEIDEKAKQVADRLKSTKTADELGL